MYTTSLKHKSDHFSSLEEYLDFRIVDCGAPYVMISNPTAVVQGLS